MKFSLYQFNPIWEDKKSNQQKIIEHLEKSNIDTDVLIFPEMTLTGFTMRSNRFSESINGESVNFFQSIANEKNMHIFAGLIEEENSNYFNTLIHVNRRGDIAAKYQKIHPFSFSGEDRHFSPGNDTVLSNVDEMKIGLSICYDLRFPELFRQYGKNRVDAIINIANWPIVRIEHFRHLLKARAIENLCYVIGVNRVGKDKGNEYNGQSSIYDPLGENILQIDDSEKIESSDLNIRKVKQAREKFPFLDDIKLI
jgi:omega-amidase